MKLHKRPKNTNIFKFCQLHEMHHTFQELLDTKGHLPFWKLHKTIKKYTRLNNVECSTDKHYKSLGMDGCIKKSRSHKGYPSSVGHKWKEPFHEWVEQRPMASWALKPNQSRESLSGKQVTPNCILRFRAAIYPFTGTDLFKEGYKQMCL